MNDAIIHEKSCNNKIYIFYKWNVFSNALQFATPTYIS